MDSDQNKTSVWTVRNMPKEISREIVGLAHRNGMTTAEFLIDIFYYWKNKDIRSNDQEDKQWW